MRPKITYSFIHSKPDTSLIDQCVCSLPNVDSCYQLAAQQVTSASTQPVSPPPLLLKSDSLFTVFCLLCRDPCHQFMRFHFVFACIFYFFIFLPFFNPVLGFWNEPRYFVLFCRPEKISPSSTFAALCSAPLCSGVKSERQVESLLRSRCGHKTSTPGTSFSWQAGAAAGICIRSHPSLTVRTCWPHWPEGALLGTYAPFHCLPAL